jgi:RimJ/RimL family protein N-acetyltransferase
VSAPPKTVLLAAPDEAQAIRAAVLAADPSIIDTARALAVAADAASLTAMLADPRVSEPIYDLPRPITAEGVRGWIDDCQAAHGRGEGLLVLNHAETGEVIGYSKITVWPELSSAELAGALRADRQGLGQGGAGAARVIRWMFEGLGVRLICLTAAPDNVRSARLIDAMGFTRMGERDCIAADGSARPSLYWEMTREAWRGETTAA